VGISAGTGATSFGAIPVTFTSIETMWGAGAGRETHHAATSVTMSAREADVHFHHGYVIAFLI